VTLRTGSPLGSWSRISALKNTANSRLRLYVPAVLLLAIAQFSADAAAQVVDAPAGPSPGELQCPHHRHSGASRHKHYHEEAFEPPSSEELAELPVQDEAPPQQVTLNGVVQRDASRPFSIALWGDSHVAANYFSEEMARALGVAQGRARPTFIPPTMDRSGVRLPIRKHCQSDGWDLEYAYVSRQTNVTFAKGLVNLKTSVPGSYLWVDFRVQPLVPDLRAVDVLFAPPAQGEKTAVGITVDDGAEQLVELEQGGGGLIHIHAQAVMSTLKLRLIEGSLVLQGFIPDYLEKPALNFDTFGIPGATAHGWKAVDAEYLRKRGGGTDYNLVILEYGTNEGNNRGFDPDKYAADLRATLQNLRHAYPESPCVLIGPTDRGVLVKRSRRKKNRRAPPPPANILKYSRIHQRIGNIQNTIAQEFSCSFWSWQDAMGGPGAAYRWLHRSPPLMARDLIHLTIPGYQLSARKFVSDIGLSKYLHQGAE